VVLEQNSIAAAALSSKGNYFSTEARSHALSSGDLAHTGLTFVKVKRELN